MSDFLDSFTLSLLVIFSQVLLPGLALCLLTYKKLAWSLVDAFFIGFLWNAFLSLLIVPFVESTTEISLYIRFLSALLVIMVSAFFLVYGRNTVYRQNFIKIFNRFFTKSHLLLTVLVIGITTLFIATHNLGFDEVANLKYINDAVAGEPYPVFRLLVDEWYAARYPLYGLVLAQLGQGFEGSALFLYYLLGMAIILGFVLKVYEILLAGKVTRKVAFSVATVVVAILAAFSFDNYLNFGIYPLQQAKLLFILGFIYVFIGWGMLRRKAYFIIGSFLISASALYHINVLLLYLVVIPFFILLVFIVTSGKEQWGIYLLFFFTPALISLPAVLSPENGILHYKEESEPVSTKPSVKTEVKKISQFELLVKKAKKLFTWLKDGRYKNKYFVRVFSLEVLLIPLLILAAIQLTVINQLSLLLLTVSLLIIVQQLAVTVPRQLTSSVLRSGTVWMLYDIARLGRQIDKIEDNIYTDTYTAFYLKLLGYKKVNTLDPKSSIIAFSPIFSNSGIDFIAKKYALNENAKFLLNGRFWGKKAVDERNKEGAGEVEQLSIDLHRFYDQNNVQRIGAIAKSFFDFSVKQLTIPILVYSAEYSGNNANDWKLLEDLSKKDSVTIYRNTAIVPLKNLQSGDELSFKFKGYGDITYSGLVTGRNESALSTVAVKKDYIKLSVSKDIVSAFFLFQMDFGHLGELGTIQSVSVSSENP